MSNKNQAGSGSLIPIILIVLVVSFTSWMVVNKKSSDTKHVSTQNKVQPHSVIENTQNSQSTQPTKYPHDINWESVKLLPADEQRKNDLQTMEFRIAAYAAVHSKYPTDATEASNVQDKDPLSDPVTGTDYRFVDGSPSIGEMQYKLSADCDSTNRSISDVNSAKIFALVIPLSEGSFICMSNV